MICASCQCGINDRGDLEEPELSERPASHEEGGTVAAGPVEGESSDRNADQVKQRQGRPDRDGRETLLSPAMSE